MNDKNIKVSERERERVSSSLFNEIISLKNLFLSWKEFKKGKTKKADVLEFQRNLENQIKALHVELKNKKYAHSPYFSFYIKDPKLRHIHKATVRDRTLHHAIFRILYYIFNKHFIFDSYSCRINKGTHRAVNRLSQFLHRVSKNNSQNCFALKLDIRKFFDSIDHRVLINLIKKRISDEDVIDLLQKIIDSFHVKERQGIPLGNVISQLFANIYLNELDQFIKHHLKIKYYIRYCDDFIILERNKSYLENLVPEINQFLKDYLKLALHEDKIVIRKYRQGIDFLGYVVFPYHRILRTKTKGRILKKLENKLINFKNSKISEKSFYQTIQSYFGILSHCNSYKIKENIKSFISNISML